mgnify:CR=1 FL=1
MSFSYINSFFFSLPSKIKNKRKFLSERKCFCSTTCRGFISFLPEKPVSYGYCLPRLRQWQRIWLITNKPAPDVLRRTYGTTKQPVWFPKSDLTDAPYLAYRWLHRFCEWERKKQWLHYWASGTAQSAIRQMIFHSAGWGGSK